MMSPVFKEQLMGALRTAVQSFNHGDSPNTAVVKAAAANDFNVEQTRRLCEVFNSARTVYHFKHASDRTTTFPLADADEVTVALFKHATPAQTANTNAHSEDDYASLYTVYTREPGNFNDKVAGEFTLDDLIHPVSVGDGVNAEARIALAFRAVADDKAWVKHSLDTADAAEVDCENELRKLASALVRSEYYHGNDLVARLLHKTAGSDEYKPVVEQLIAILPERMHVTDVDFKKLGHVVDDSMIADMAQQLAGVKDMLADVAALRGMAATLNKEAATAEAQLMASVKSWSGMGVGTSEEPFADTFTDTIKEAQYGQRTVKVKQPVMGGGKWGLPEMQEVSETLPRSSVLDTKEQLHKSLAENSANNLITQFGNVMNRERHDDNKKVSDRWDNVKREVLLHELMLNDPVLSEADPGSVANAYLTIQQTAPEMSTNKEVVRAVLRQAVHATAISPFDANSWAELEKNVRTVLGNMPPTKQLRMEQK